MMNLGLSLGIGSQCGSAAAFDPSSLFASSEQGAWYDPSDLATMSQTSDGPLGNVAVGDPVGRIEDKSGNGNHATQATAAARPILRQDGALYYLETDGVDDWMPATGADLGETWTHVGGWYALADTNNRAFAISSNGDASPLLPRTGNWQGVNSVGGFTDYSTRSGSAEVVTLEQASLAGLTTRFNGVSGTGMVPFDQTADTQGLALFSSTNTAGDREFYGRFYGGLWIARALTGAELAASETYVATQSGVTLP